MLDKLVITGRVQKFLEGAGSLPVSCTITDFDTEGDFIRYTLLALKGGAGVNIHLDALADFTPRITNIKFSLDPHHPEYVEGLWGIPTDDDWRLEDSIDGRGGIADFCIRLFQGKLNGQTIDMSAIRPNGTESKTMPGMIASGVVSCRNLLSACACSGGSVVQYVLSILSTCNQEMRRGGILKNGAVTTSMPSTSPLIWDYVELSPHKHNYLKKAVVMFSDYGKLDEDLVDTLIDGVNDGTLWLEKRLSTQYFHTPKAGYKRYHLESDSPLPFLQHNVCREILINKRETCNLFHVNLGMIDDPEQLEDVLPFAVSFGIEIHKRDGQALLDIYKSASEDKQIGVGLVGLANMLRNFGVTYHQFTEALASLTTDEYLSQYANFVDFNFSVNFPKPQRMADMLAQYLVKGYLRGSREARIMGYKRVWCIAPTASSSYRYKDFAGNALAPQITPPLAQTVERVSERGETLVVDYGRRIETAEKVGYDTYFKLVESFQKLFDSTGLGHSISFDIHKEWDLNDFRKWMDSQITATYYRVLTDTSHLDKSDQLNISCSGCVE